MNPIALIMQITGLGKVGSVLALIAAVVGGCSLWLHFHDKGVVADHETEMQADVVDATGEASAAADAAAAEYEAEFGKRQDTDRKDIDDAKHDQSSPFDGMFD